MAYSDPRMEPMYLYDSAPLESRRLMAAIMECEFDAITNEDELLILAEMEQKRKTDKASNWFYKRFCIIKTASLFTDLLFGTPLMGLSYAKKRLSLQKTMFGYLMGKKTYQDLIKHIEKACS